LNITVTDICSFNTKFNKMEEDKNLEQNLDKSNEKLHISDVRRMLIDFGIWIDKNDRYLENGNITKNVDEFLKSINYV
jgi:hypothetical protein